MRWIGRFLLLVCIPVSGAWAQSLDLAVRGFGLSLGNSSRFNGLRVNAVDHGVEQVNGFNLTAWNPHKNADAVYNGIAG